MHVARPGISRLGRALAGGREQRKQIKAQKLAESNAFPYPGTELRKLRWLVAGRIPDVPGSWVRARHPPGLTGPGRGRGTGHLPACPAAAAVTCPPTRDRVRHVESVPSPRTCRAPASSEPADFAAVLHHSPYTMRCSLPIPAPAPG